MDRPRDPLRRVAQYRVDRLVAQDAPGTAPDGAALPASGTSAGTSAGAPAAPPGTDSGTAPDTDPGTASGAASGTASDTAPGTASPRPPGAPRPSTMAARGSFADELVRQAMARGEFDGLPLTGKPIPGLTGRYDPDWWLKAFIEREGITGVLPEALQLRKDDAALDGVLDAEHLEEGVRQAVEEFNARVVEARRQLLGGPPVVTPTRDVESEVRRWRERRRAPEEDRRTATAPGVRDAGDAARRNRAGWWGRRRSGWGRHDRAR